MKKLESIIIKLSKWRCGDYGFDSMGEGKTFLLNNQGYKCCLGFACQQIGYKGLIRGMEQPSSITKSLDKLNVKINRSYFKNSDFSESAIRINDSEDMTMTERKTKLVALGKKHSIRISFVP